jgi:hypothetical protein
MNGRTPQERYVPSPSSDIYSYGCIIHEVSLSGQQIEADYIDVVRFFQVKFLGNLTQYRPSWREGCPRVQILKTCRMRIGYLYYNVGFHSLPFGRSHRKRSNLPELGASSYPQVIHTDVVAYGSLKRVFLL